MTDPDVIYLAALRALADGDPEAARRILAAARKDS